MAYPEKTRKAFKSGGTGNSIWIVREYDEFDNSGYVWMFKEKKDAYKFANWCFQNDLNVDVEHDYFYTEPNFSF